MHQLTNADLRAERGDVLKEAKRLSDRGKLNATEQRRFDDLMRESERLKAAYSTMETGGMAEFRGGAIGNTGRTQSTKDTEHREAFASYLRLGKNEMPSEHRSFLDANYRAPIERRDMGSGGGNALQGTGGEVDPIVWTKKRPFLDGAAG